MLSISWSFCFKKTVLPKQLKKALVKNALVDSSKNGYPWTAMISCSSILAELSMFLPKGWIWLVSYMTLWLVAFWKVEMFSSHCGEKRTHRSTWALRPSLVYIWNNELERAKDMTCVWPLRVLFGIGLLSTFLMFISCQKLSIQLNFYNL